MYGPWWSTAGGAERCLNVPLISVPQRSTDGWRDTPDGEEGPGFTRASPRPEHHDLERIWSGEAGNCRVSLEHTGRYYAYELVFRCSSSTQTKPTYWPSRRCTPQKVRSPSHEPPNAHLNTDSRHPPPGSDLESRSQIRSGSGVTPRGSLQEVLHQPHRRTDPHVSALSQGHLP